jgi:hypothetical protein
LFQQQVRTDLLFQQQVRTGAAFVLSSTDGSRNASQRICPRFTGWPGYMYTYLRVTPDDGFARCTAALAR